MSSVRRLLGYESVLNTMKLDERVIKWITSRWGSDYEKVSKEATACFKPKCKISEASVIFSNLIIKKKPQN
jgi:hypothetical protein